VPTRTSNPLQTKPENGTVAGDFIYGDDIYAVH
jgi:hypothetical protein